MKDSMDKNSSPEGAAEQVLRDGLKANGLSPEALQRIRQATEREWRATTQVPAEQARRPWRALVAGVAASTLAAIAGWTYLSADVTSGNGAILGELAHFDAPGVTQVRPLRRDVDLVEGAKLRAGQSLDIRGDSLVALAGGGNIRIARASAIEVMSESAVVLELGELYVDIPPGSPASRAFKVVTDAGEFRHLGTQFAVAIVAGQTRLRVREGSVVWRAAAEESIVPAGTEVLIENGRATRRSISTAGGNWAWIESLTPAVSIEDRPLIEFLEWFARETGRKLVIGDAEYQQAASIRMHGNVQGLTLTEALSAVMATTTLRYELPEGVIRVSSTRESKAQSP